MPIPINKDYLLKIPIYYKQKESHAGIHNASYASIYIYIYI